MPVGLGVEVDPVTRGRLQRELSSIKNGFPRALATAVNRTARTGNSKISQAVRKEIRVNKSSADKRISIKYRATPQNPTGVIRVERGSYGGRASPLITSFRGTRDTRVYASGARAGELRRTRAGRLSPGRGVKARPRVKGGTQTIRHAFIVAGRGGTRIALARAKDGRMTGWDKTRQRLRVATVAMLGPTVLGVFDGKPGLRRRVESELSVVLEKNLLSQADRLLQRSRIAR